MDYPNDPSIGLVNGKFVDDDPVAGVPGSIIAAGWANAIMSELLAVIQAAGMTPAENQLDQLLRAIRINTRKDYFKTFTEVSALQSDEGPIICADMAGDVYTWVDNQYFTGYRSPFCGAWVDGWTPTPLPFQIEAVGGTWDESNEKEKRVIARYRESGLVVPSGDWIKGQNMIADLGGGLWKAPDLQDMFKRMAGTDVDTANARLLGTHQEDALQNITGSWNNSILRSPIPGDSSGAFNTDGPISTSGATGGPNQGQGFTFDSSRVARTSTETRPTNTTVAPLIHV